MRKTRRHHRGRKTRRGGANSNQLPPTINGLKAEENTELTKSTKAWYAKVAANTAARNARAAAKVKINMEEKANPKKSLWNRLFGINYT